MSYVKSRKSYEEQEMSDEDTLRFKIVLAGDGAVGKTSLRKKYMGEGFEVDYKQTIGADYALCETKLENSAFKFQIWDLAGQPIFKDVVKPYYEGSTGAIMVYDVTRAESLDNLKHWINDLFNYGGLMPVVIVGNKIDLKRVVPPEAGKTFVADMSNNYGITFHYFETSAVTGVNVKETFEALGKDILEKIEKVRAKITE
ncbi:MAG: Rab family GTPase [Promethearchaeota archaeon]